MQQNEKAKRQAQDALIAQLEANKQIQEHYSQSLEMKVRERTAEIALQKEEIEAQKESIQHQNELLEHKNIELQSLNEEKNHLMGVLAHDLRNPLTSGLTVANLLKEERELLHPDHIEYAEHLQRSLVRMEEMIASALQQTADEATRLKLNWEEVDLGQLAKESLQEQMSKAQAKQLTFKCACAPASLTLDRQYAQRIVDNLISNAIKYSPIGGHIQVTVAQEHNKVQLRVSDQGIGIAPDEMHKLFRKFQRLSSKPTAGETSTGLGLSIVKKYTEAMGGEVGCESVLGQGSAFWVVFETE
jgi:signal transduction histidine kinase